MLFNDLRKRAKKQLENQLNNINPKCFTHLYLNEYFFIVKECFKQISENNRYYNNFSNVIDIKDEDQFKRLFDGRGLYHSDYGDTEHGILNDIDHNDYKKFKWWSSI